MKALREIANPQGSSIQNVERHLRKVYSEVIDPGFLFEELLRSASKKAVTKNLASHDGSYTYFKSTSAFKKQSLPSGGGTGTPTLKPKKATNTLDSYLTTSKPKPPPSIPSAPILEDKYEDSVSTKFPSKRIVTHQYWTNKNRKFCKRSCQKKIRIWLVSNENSTIYKPCKSIKVKSAMCISSEIRF